MNDGTKFRDAVKACGLSWWACYDRIRVFNETPEQAIQHFKDHPPVHYKFGDKSLRQHCKDVGVPYQSVAQFHKDFPHIPLKDIIEGRLWHKNYTTDTQWCKEHNISYPNAKSRFRYYQIYKDEQRTFREFCKDIYKDCYKL